MLLAVQAFLDESTSHGAGRTKEYTLYTKDRKEYERHVKPQACQSGARSQAAAMRAPGSSHPTVHGGAFRCAPRTTHIKSTYSLRTTNCIEACDHNEQYPPPASTGAIY